MLKNLNNLRLCPELTEFRENIFQKGQRLVDLKQEKTFMAVMNPVGMNMDFQVEDQQYENMPEEMNIDDQASINSGNQNC